MTDRTQATLLVAALAIGVCCCDLLATVHPDWLGRDDSERVQALRARLEHIVRQTGPHDTRPTVIVQHGEIEGGIYKCEIECLEGRNCVGGRHYWDGLGHTASEAASKAFEKYWRQFR